MLAERFSSAGACSNRFLEGMLGYVESPCFSRCCVSTSINVDHGGHNTTCLYIAVFWECA
jgi:hypothetical protein